MAPGNMELGGVPGKDHLLYCFGLGPRGSMAGELTNFAGGLCTEDMTMEIHNAVPQLQWSQEVCRARQNIWPRVSCPS